MGASYKKGWPAVKELPHSWRAISRLKSDFFTILHSHAWSKNYRTNAWLLIDWYHQNVSDPRSECQQLATQDTKVRAIGSFTYQMSVTLTSATKKMQATMSFISSRECIKSTRLLSYKRGRRRQRGGIFRSFWKLCSQFFSLNQSKIDETLCILEIKSLRSTLNEKNNRWRQLIFSRTTLKIVFCFI